jgi:phenylpropionate dioxygenase-like ring-hydroxylating dioxygenase large terminal subunit
MDFAEDRRLLVARLVELGKTRRAAMAERTFTVPGSKYIDPERFADELTYLFRRQPQLLAFSGQLAQPGDFVTMTIAGVPLILLRGQDGVVRGFRNSCLHRGATLLSDASGCGRRRLVCPFHSWVYDDQGTLIGLPERDAFPHVEVGVELLPQILVQEQHGVIYGQIEGESMDLESFLGPVLPRLELLGLAAWEVVGPERVSLDANWKLTMETFGEGYHVPSLHKDTLRTRWLGTAMDHERYGRHVRQAIPYTSILDFDDEARWGEAVSGVDFMELLIVFPNVSISIVDSGAVLIHRVLPGEHVGRSHLDQFTLYSPRLTGVAREETAKFLSWAWTDVIVAEDMSQCEGIYDSLTSASIESMRFGRNEWTIHDLHTYYDETVSKGQVGAD